MAYTIRYSPENNRKYPIDKPVRRSAWLVLVGAIAVAGLLLLNETVRNAVTDFFLPGDPQVTKEALIQLVDDVRGGESVVTAITTFCQYVINHA